LLLHGLKLTRSSFVDGAVRYVRIDAPIDWLQISQLAVFDATGTNLAFHKETHASPVFDESIYGTQGVIFSADGAVDGTLAAKTFSTPCDGCAYHCNASSGCFWYVDLGGDYNISNVAYYSRLEYDHSPGYVLTALDYVNRTLASWTMGGGMDQNFEWEEGKANVGGW
jgi:hypothetical protein